MTKGNMQVRVVSLAVLIAAVFLILGARLWYLQVLTGQDYTLAARATQHTNIKIPAQRGVVYDRDGKILANNVPGLNVTVIPDEISRDKVRELATVVGADTESVLARYDAAMETGSQYSPILVKENAGRDAVTYVSERTGEFTGRRRERRLGPQLPRGQAGRAYPRVHRRRQPRRAEAGTFQGPARRLYRRQEWGRALLRGGAAR